MKYEMNLSLEEMNTIRIAAYFNLEYWIYESDNCNEYDTEINATLLILEKLNVTAFNETPAEKYRTDYNNRIREMIENGEIDENLNTL